MSRILLIEDSPTQAAEFSWMLKDAGFEVDHADTLQGGMEKLRQGGVDVLLLDLTLPDSEGLQTLLTARSQAGKVPIVVLTHIDDEQLATTTLQKGAQDYLVKGEVNQNWLARSIHNALARPQLVPVAPQKTKSAAELLEFEKHGDVTIASLRARRLLDAPQIADLGERLARAVKSDCRKLVLSFADVEYVSNGALGVLLGIRRKAIGKGGKFCFCDVSSGVREQLTVRKFHKLFEIFENRDAALQSLVDR